jgi:hypothetical protein
VRLQRGRDVDAADEGGVLRKDVDQPFLAQLDQRIAHRCLADAEALGQLGPRQHRARRQLQRQDALAQRVVGSAARPGAAVQPAGDALNRVHGLSD